MSPALASLFKSCLFPFRYPLVIPHGHYSAEFNCGGTFSEDPPSPDRTGYDYTGTSTTHCPSYCSPQHADP